jgi:hypothetical protein
MVSAAFRRNRPDFPVDELRKHVGNWLAFSGDGRRILASAKTLTSLEERLAQMQQDPTQVCFEFVHGPEDDTFIGLEGNACCSPTRAP